ncbi:MAG: hypothetical protein WCJ84_02085 [Candidatus Peregrinibacteria bacterium]
MERGILLLLRHFSGISDLQKQAFVSRCANLSFAQREMLYEGLLKAILEHISHFSDIDWRNRGLKKEVVQKQIFATVQNYLYQKEDIMHEAQKEVRNEQESLSHAQDEQNAELFLNSFLQKV